jgi:hypothetical protein
MRDDNLTEYNSNLLHAAPAMNPASADHGSTCGIGGKYVDN